LTRCQVCLPLALLTQINEVDLVPVEIPSVGHALPRDSPAATPWEIGTTAAEIAKAIAIIALNAFAFLRFIYFSLFEGW
jgi:hypothetical protein